MACRWLTAGMRSRSSRRVVPTKRSAMALARGARTGFLSPVAPMALKDGVKRGGELGVAVPDEEPEPAVGVG